jgi:methylglutamate dehydrogenase subunit A
MLTETAAHCSPFRRRFSLIRLLAEAARGHANWRPMWRSAVPRKAYDAIIVGGGAHGLATAFYLAHVYGMRNVALLERGWIGLGNAGRNTTIIRSNYLLQPNIRFYEWALKLWEDLERELNYNVMVSQRGVIGLFHSAGQRDALIRRGNGMRLLGIEAELLDREQVRELCPLLDMDSARFPIMGGLMQRRGGTVRHDAVVWGYARGADALGVDIIQNCEVTGFLTKGSRIEGVKLAQGTIRSSRVGVAVAGHSSKLAALAGLRLPIESHVLQAFVTEAVKPLVHQVVSFGAEHFFINQSDKGGLVFSGDIDGYNTYAQRGNLPVVEHVCESAIALMPSLSRLRILRSWGGVMDMSMDGSPIIDHTGIEGLYLNAGWCYGGFKATPASGWSFAHLLATGEHHPLARDYRIDRFATGRLIDERGIGPYPHRH